jgi:type I restriction-modification system DNA methylase subunit
MINYKTMSKQEFINFLWKLHNICRNGRGTKITNLPAMYETNNIITLKLLEIHNLENIYNIPETCRFSYIYNEFCSQESYQKEKKTISELTDTNEIQQRETFKNYYKIYNHYCNPDNEENVLIQLMENPIMVKIFKSSSSTPSSYYIKNKPQVGHNLIELFTTVYEQFKNTTNLTIEMNMFSDAYEEWKTSSDGNSNKLSDQHFTPFPVQEYIINNLEPNETDIFYEPCGGGGGFAIKFKQYLRKNNMDTTIFDNTCAINEINPEIHRLLFANMLINKIPLNDLSGNEKIRDNDSLDPDFCYQIKGTKTKIATNPPFSLRDSLDYSEYYFPLKGTKNKCIKNGTAMFIIHCIQSLTENGKCGIVISRDILVNGDDKKNSWEKKFRKYIFEKVNIYKIVLLPTGIFPFTNFATAILFFNRGCGTSNTSIINGEFTDIGSKTGLQEGEEIYNLPIKELQEKEYNLSSFLKEEILVEKNNEEMIILGDIIEYVKYESKKDEYKIENGKYPFYNSTILEHLYCNEYTNDEKCLIINKVNGSGKYKIFYNASKFSATSGVIIFKSKQNYLLKYIYYYLVFDKVNVESKYAGGDKKSLSKSNFETILIPNIPLTHQQEIVEFLDLQFNKYDISKLNKQIPLFKYLLKKEYQMATELLHLVFRQMATEEEIENINKDIKAIFNLRVYNLECEYKNLGDIIKFNIGGTPSRTENKYFNGDNLWASISDLHNNIIYDTKEKITKEGIENSSVKIIEKGSVLMSFMLTIGKMGIAGSNMYCNQAIMFFKHENEITNKYLYYWLLFNNNEISKLTKGNIGIGGLNKTTLSKILIKIPCMEIQNNIICNIENMKEKTKTYLEYSEYLGNQLLLFT